MTTAATGGSSSSTWAPVGCTGWRPPGPRVPDRLVGPPFGVTRPPVRRLGAGRLSLAMGGDLSGRRPLRRADPRRRRRAGAPGPGDRVGPRMAARILVIDNYDSFVYNLVQYLGELGAEPLVHRSDALTLDEIDRPRPRRRADQPRPRTPRGCRAVQRGHHPLRRPRPGVRRVPRPPVHRPGLRRRGGAGARRSCTARPRSSATTTSACSPGCPSPLEATRYHSPGGRPRLGARRARDHRRDRRRHRHGAAPPRATTSRACSSTPSRSSPSAATTWSATSWPAAATDSATATTPPSSSVASHERAEDDERA